MMPEQFYKCTYRQFVLMARGFNRRREYEFENTRMICYMIFAANRDPKKALPSIQHFWPLSIDERIEKDPEAAQKELAELRNQIKEKYGAFLNKSKKAQA